MVICTGFKDIFNPSECFRKRFRVVILADMQNEGFGFTDLLRKLSLCAKRDEFAMIDDADPVRKFLGLFHIMCSVKHSHALLVEVFNRVENGTP